MWDVNGTYDETAWIFSDPISFTITIISRVTNICGQSLSFLRSFCRRAYAALAGGKNICPLLKNLKINQIGYRNVGRVSWKVFHIWHGKMMRYSNFIQKAQVQKLDTVYSRLLNITCLGNFNFPVISLNDVLIIEVYFRLFSKMVNHVH